MNNNLVTTILYGNDRRGVIHTADRFHSVATDSRKHGERAPSSTPQAVLCKSDHQLGLGPIKPSKNSARSARCLRCGVPKEAPSAPANPNYHSLANFTQMLQDELALEGSSS